MAIFSPEKITYFFRGYDESMEEFSPRKKVSVTHQKMGIGPLKQLQKEILP